MSSVSATTTCDPSPHLLARGGSGRQPTTRTRRLSWPSPIRTLTVGPGFRPGRPHDRMPWARGLPGFKSPHYNGETAAWLPPVGTCTQPRGLHVVEVVRMECRPGSPGSYQVDDGA